MNLEPQIQPEQSRIGIMPFYVLVWLMIGLGIFFRFYNLDHHAYWHDEAITSLHIGGHAKWQLEEAIDRHILSFDELRKYTTPQGLPAAWQWWTYEQPEKAPLFYILEYLFASTFGTTVANMRLLPALLSLLQLPAFYWFGRELFEKKSAALLMAALVAMSPFAVMNAQEAREYGLIFAMIAATSAAYLRAYRLNDFKSWCLYSIVLTVSLYASLMTPLYFLAHASHLLLTRKSHQGTGRLKQMSIACLVAVIAFIPWICVNIPALARGYSIQWMSQRPPSIGAWLLSMLKGLDANYLRLDLVPKGFIPVVTLVCWLMLALFAVVLLPVLAQPGPLILPLLFVVSSLPIILPDVISGGIRATIQKYFSHVAVVAISITAYAITNWMEQPSRAKQALAWVLVLMIFAIQGFSCFEYSQATESSTRAMAHPSIPQDGKESDDVFELLSPISQFIESSPEVLIVSDRGTQFTNFMQLLALAIENHTKTRVLYFIKPEISDEAFSSIGSECYLYNPSKELLSTFDKAGFETTPVNQMSYFLNARKKSGQPNANPHPNSTPLKQKPDSSWY